MALPTGKGMYIWQLWRLEGSTPELIQYDKIVQVAVDAGITHVYIKAAAGTFLYNVRWGNYPSWGGMILEDYVVKISKKFEAAGIQVIPWHYIFGWRPVDEAKMSVRRVEQLGSEVFVIDAEAQLKHKPEEAGEYVAGLLKDMPMGVKIGHTAYRYPVSHPNFPWPEILGICDFVNQQVYWEGAHNPADQLNRSMEQFYDLLDEIGKDIPQHPIGSAYRKGSWQVTERDLQEFLERGVQLGLPSISLWSWESMRASDNPVGEKLWDLYAAFDWREPAPPPVFTHDQKVELLWKEHKDLHRG